jgi:hypothetical protein
MPGDGGRLEIKWVQEFFFAELEDPVLERLSLPTSERLEEIPSEEYYGMARSPGTGLPVPADLDSFICLYLQLSPSNRAMFDRATFWLDMASRQWNISMSASFASLVSAIESLTRRGEVHWFKCPKCGVDTQHEVAGATRRFRDFFDTYAPGAALAKRRNEMYSLRSGILHGSQLMQLDQDLARGWDPPWWDERELHEELWGLTRIALRNWLRNPPQGC